MRIEPSSIQCGPPSDVCWFINPRNTILMSIINHSYWSYKPTQLMVLVVYLIWGMMYQWYIIFDLGYDEPVVYLIWGMMIYAHFGYFRRTMLQVINRLIPNEWQGDLGNDIIVFWEIKSKSSPNQVKSNCPVTHPWIMGK